MELLQSASNLGSANATYQIGNLYYFGKSVPENKQTAFLFWRLAADQGDPTAMAELGMKWRLQVI
jgi:TPR repeat protein